MWRRKARGAPPGRSRSVRRRLARRLDRADLKSSTRRKVPRLRAFTRILLGQRPSLAPGQKPLTGARCGGPAARRSMLLDHLVAQHRAQIGPRHPVEMIAHVDVLVGSASSRLYATWSPSALQQVVDAPHEHAVIGLVERGELAVVDEPGRDAAHARRRRRSCRPLRPGAVQGVLVLLRGAAEVEQQALQRLAVLAERLGAGARRSPRGVTSYFR